MRITFGKENGMINLLEDDTMTLGEFIGSKFYHDGGWELCKGQLVLMSPARISHEYVIQRVGHLIQGYLEAKNRRCKVYGSNIGVRLWEDDSHIQPDISMSCGESKIKDGWFLRVPELVVEVLSASTRLYDLNQKRDIYAEYGGVEYWAIDLENRYVIVENFGNKSKITYYSGDIIKSFVLDDFNIAVDEIFAYM
jgi:Uma2 family endonuclease